jgi:hypothetical protein
LWIDPHKYIDANLGCTIWVPQQVRH